MRLDARRVLRDTEAARAVWDSRSSGIDRLCGFADIAQLQQAHREWVTAGLKQTLARHDRWSEALASAVRDLLQR
jgi:hypothetical protein